MMKSFLVGLCIATALTGQTPAPRDAIRKVLDDQVVAWNRGDLAGFMDGYWKSEQLTFYAGNDKTTGWQSLFDRYKKKYQGEGKEMGTLAFSQTTIDLIGAEHALVTGRWTVTMKNSTPTGLFTLMMRRLPEGWRITHDHTSN